MTKSPDTHTRPRIAARFAATTFTTLCLGTAMLLSGAVWGVNLSAPPSLKTVPIPEPPNLAEFVKDRKAAVALGKALFWDMQVGSDGIQACASCHFHAGADNRTTNQLSPGINAGDGTFQVVGPNDTLQPADYPFHRLVDPEDRASAVLYDVNDVTSSQGAHNFNFLDIRLGSDADSGTVVPDPVFNDRGVNTRRVEPRNAPTVINAVFNFANFWDGRANNIFNGVNPFGDADADARVFVNNDGVLEQQRVSIPNASLASQAVGPPTSNFEMSYAGRTFPKLGKKLLHLTPLAKQQVDANDSVLGALASTQSTQRGRARRRGASGAGLATTYAEMIRAAFQDKYWSSTESITFPFNAATVVTQQGRTSVVEPGPARAATSRGNRNRGRRVPSGGGDGDTNIFSQMEANFALFFGLAIQMYESTLVSDDTPFDRFQEGDDSAMSPSAQQGLNLFLATGDGGGGNCINCHGGSEFTNASVSHVGSVIFTEPLPEALMERMAMGDGNGAFYDAGYYNIGVRPTEEDVGRGGDDAFGFPLSFTKRALLLFNGTTLPFANPQLPCGDGRPVPCTNQRSAVDGAFKAPGLRNVELTGPYFHNGGQATLMQVMDFYTRGGDFHERNIANLDPDIIQLLGFRGNPFAQNAVVDFLLALTDERVRNESAPFDHPQLFVPNGYSGSNAPPPCTQPGCETLVEIPAVGAAGRRAAGLPPLQPFMGLDPRQP